MSVVEIIQHYQRSIEKCSGNEERMLYCIGKLYRLPVTVQHLKETGVGRTVNGLRKYVGDVGDAAKALVAKWKNMVADEESSDGEPPSDDDANISEPPDDYGNNLRNKKNEKDSSDDRDDRKESRSGNGELLKDMNESKSSRNETVKNSSKNSSSDKSKSKDYSHGKSQSIGGPSGGLGVVERSKHTKNELANKIDSLIDGVKIEGDKRESKCDLKSERKSRDQHGSKREMRREEKEKTRNREKDLRKDYNSSSASSSLKLSSEKHHRDEEKRKNKRGEDESHSRKRKFDVCSNDGKNDIAKIKKKRKHSESDDSDNENENENRLINSEDDRDKKVFKGLIDSESDTEVSNTIEIKIEPPSPGGKSRDEYRRSEEVKNSKEKLKFSKSKGNSLGSNNEEKVIIKHEDDKDKRKNDKFEEKTVEHRKNEKRKEGGSLNRESSSYSKSKNCSNNVSSNSSNKDNKNNHKDKEKVKDKDIKKENNRNSSDSKDPKVSSSGFKEPKEKKKVKKGINGDGGIDCNSGASFAEALGMCAFPSSSTTRKRNNSPNLSPSKMIKIEPSTSTVSRSRSPARIPNDVSSSSDNSPPSLLSPHVKLEPLSVDLASTLPEISPNYKPLPYVSLTHRRQEEDFSLSNVIYAKNQRTKVYSGNKSGYTNVPTLYDMCIRILIENIEALEFTGGVPYDIIKPVLERATPDQLFSLEHHNPYLIEDTDTLWRYHCNREFRSKHREEMETWREMYMRCLDEQEAKLKTLTANIKQSIDKSLPVRQTKLAYVDNVVKPPRNVLRKQAKYGTARSSGGSSASDLKHKLISGGGGGGMPTNISVPAPPMPRSRISSSSVVKKTKAPLMAKALQLIKGRYKR